MCASSTRRRPRCAGRPTRTPGVPQEGPQHLVDAGFGVVGRAAVARGGPQRRLVGRERAVRAGDQARVGESADPGERHPHRQAGPLGDLGRAGRTQHDRREDPSPSVVGQGPGQHMRSHAGHPCISGTPDARRFSAPLSRSVDVLCGCSATSSTRRSRSERCRVRRVRVAQQPVLLVAEDPIAPARSRDRRR